MTRASTRDASFYRRPDVRSVKVYHVIAAPGMSACGRLLYDHPESHDAAADGIEATEAPMNLRCQRPGCKTLWPAGVPGLGDGAERRVEAFIEKRRQERNAGVQEAPDGR